MLRASAAAVLVLNSFSRRSFLDRSFKGVAWKSRPNRACQGKLGVLLPGLGAVSTTFMAGVELVRQRQSGSRLGSLTQMGTIRLGKRTDARSPLIKKFVPLAELKDLTFGGWDIFKDNAYQSAANAAC